MDLQSKRGDKNLKYCFKESKESFAKDLITNNVFFYYRKIKKEMNFEKMSNLTRNIKKNIF